MSKRPSGVALLTAAPLLGILRAKGDTSMTYQVTHGKPAPYAQAPRAPRPAWQKWLIGAGIFAAGFWLVCAVLGGVIWTKTLCGVADVQRQIQQVEATNGYTRPPVRVAESKPAISAEEQVAAASESRLFRVANAHLRQYGIRIRQYRGSTEGLQRLIVESEDVWRADHERWNQAADRLSIIRVGSAPPSLPPY